jgi:hypothetical protein
MVRNSLLDILLFGIPLDIAFAFVEPVHAMNNPHERIVNLLYGLRNEERIEREFVVSPDLEPVYAEFLVREPGYEIHRQTRVG